MEKSANSNELQQGFCKNNNPSIPFTFLPKEILLHIFSFLPSKRDLCSISECCKYFQTLAFDCNLWHWKHLKLNYFKRKLKNQHLDSILIRSSKVQHLDLSKLAIDYEMLSKGLYSFSSVEVLVLKDCKLLTDECIRSMLSKMPKLRKLNLSGNSKITDDAFVGGTLEYLRDLEVIYLAGTNVKAIELEKCYSKLKNLSRIDLSKTNVTKETICKMLVSDGDRNLKKLCLQGCELDKVALLRIGKIASHLENLNINASRATFDVNDLALLVHEVANENLKQIHLSALGQVNDKIVVNLSRCLNLEVIDLSYNSRITNASIAILLQGCRKLKKLRLNGNYEITDQAFLSIKSQTDLLEVELSGLTDLGDSGLCHLIRNSSQLRDLNISQCSSISLQTFLVVVECLKGLKGISIAQCKQLDQAKVAQLLFQHFSNLNFRTSKK